jgi:putative transposase
MGTTLERLRGLYNAALEERRDAYRRQGISVNRAQQTKALTEIKHEQPEYQEIHTHLLQDVVTRLDRAFDAFFRRVKAGEKPGYPRFKGRGQYHSFTFKDAVNGNGAAMCAGGKRLRLSGIGKVKIKVHRPIEGRIKTVSVLLDGDGHWYAVLTCDHVPQRALPDPGHKALGIDVGIEAFATTSDAQRIENPRPLQSAQRELVRAQRKVQRREKGSKRRLKAVGALRKAHAKVARTRKDFHHKTALALLRLADILAVEKLNVRGLSRGMLARSVNDAGWGQFLTILCAKAESAGRTVIAVNPAGTSQVCAACGADVPKKLSEREHHCLHCGYRTHRDHNAAQNILRRALATPSQQLLSMAGAPPSGRDASAGLAAHATSRHAPDDPRSLSLGR